MKISFLLSVIMLLVGQSVMAQFKLESVFEGGDHIVFVSATEGFSYGMYADNVYHTTDAGYTWRLMATNLRSNTGGSEYILNMAFLDSNTAFAVTANATVANTTFIYKTTNGGGTWQLSYTSHTDTSGWNSPTIFNVYFTDALHGWGAGNHIVIATTDGGTTWHEQLSLPSAAAWTLEGFSFLNNSNGYICGQGGTVLHTTNGGANWTIQHIDTNGAGIGIIANLACYYQYDVYFGDAQHGYVGANNGGYMTTDNGGATWTQNITGDPYDNESVHLSDSNTVWLSGGPYCDNTGCYTNSSILYNRGNTAWHKLVAEADVYVPGALGFGKIHFLNPALGYASNDNGYVYRIIDTTVTATTGINNISPAITSIYPNPATDVINVTLNVPVTGTIALYNTVGEKMMTVTPGNKKMVTLNVANLPTGNYFIVVPTQQQVLSKSFSKL
jgi:photosystem II stability/assembly factor-like uncharacterized protein